MADFHVDPKPHERNNRAFRARALHTAALRALRARAHARTASPCIKSERPLLTFRVGCPWNRQCSGTSLIRRVGGSMFRVAWAAAVAGRPLPPGRARGRLHGRRGAIAESLGSLCAFGS